MHKKIFPCARKFIFVRIEIFLRAHGDFSPSVRKRFSFLRAIFFPLKEKELSYLGKRIFLRWKRRFPSKERIPSFEGKRPSSCTEKATRGAGYTRPPIRFFRCSTGKSGATPVEGRWKRYCFFSGVGLVMKTRLSAGTRVLNHCWSLACSGAGSALPDSKPRSTAM